MTISKIVKCIRIDPENRVLSYVDCDIPVGDRPQVFGFQKGIVRTAEQSMQENGIRSAYVLNYKEGVINDPAQLPKFGFLWRYSGDLNEEFEIFGGNFIDVSGNALLIKYENYYERNGEPAMPCDINLSLEDARKMIGEFTNGVYFRLPEFTCILNGSFSQSGHELLLRIENDAFLEFQHWHEVTKPVRMLSPEIINFAVDYNEVTIVTGKVESLQDKVRVVIYEAGTSELRQIAACSLTASKIPHWVQDRLRDYFFEKFVAERFIRTSGLHKPQPNLQVVQPQGAEVSSLANSSEV